MRLGLASDGFNPFRTLSSTHSTWPVVLMVYNLPPWMSMKPDYFMLSLLIPGPQSPGNDIDVYLQPLIEELKELWESGVETYDSNENKTFNMRACLCGQLMTSLRMLSYLGGVQRENWLVHVVMMRLLLSI